MPYEHESGLANSFNRVGDRQDLQSVVFYGERPLVQGAELVDLQEIIRGRQKRVGRLIAKDGDRVENASGIVDRDAGTVTLTAGKIYLEGDVFPVPERVFTAVPMTGRVVFGVRLVKTYPTGDDDVTLRGLVPGSDAENENGAAREVATITWARASVAQPGAFFQVYVMQDGTLLDQTPPPLLDGIAQGLAAYDRPNGNYIVRGHSVSALGLQAGMQVFSIEEGEANVNGFKVTREAALRYAEDEEWDVGAVAAESHPYPGGASQVIRLDEGPIATITSVVVTKQRTVTLTRGPVANGMDALPNTSVIEIVSIAGYASNTYLRTGNNVDWGPVGAEPAVGASYDVTYRWRDAVTPTDVTSRTITVSGGAANGEVIINYTFKLPRIDIIGSRIPTGKDPRCVTKFLKPVTCRISAAPAVVPATKSPSTKPRQNTKSCARPSSCSRMTSPKPRPRASNHGRHRP